MEVNDGGRGGVLVDVVVEVSVDGVFWEDKILMVLKEFGVGMFGLDMPFGGIREGGEADEDGCGPDVVEVVGMGMSKGIVAKEN